MTARLERILTKLARERAPHLLVPGWNTQMEKTVRQLAEYDFLILMASVREAHILDWVDTYISLYRLLAQELFPTFAQSQWQFADQQQPPIVLIQGKATAVIEAMAGFVVPYVVLRQNQTVPEDEVRYLMHLVIIEQLMGEDLSHAQYKQLSQDCVNLIQTLLAIPAHHVGLTHFDRQLFAVPAPPPVQQQPPPPPPPVKPTTVPKPRPEDDKKSPPDDLLDDTSGTSPTAPSDPPPTQPRRPIPGPGAGSGKNEQPKRRLPVPDLPENKHSKK